MSEQDYIDLRDEVEGWIDDGRTYSTDEEENEEEQYIKDDIPADQPLNFE